jgi:hypothetical protein
MAVESRSAARWRTVRSAVSGVVGVLVLYGYFYFGVAGGLRYLQGHELDPAVLRFTAGMLAWAGACMTMIAALGVAVIAGLSTLREASAFLDFSARRWFSAALWSGIVAATTLSLMVHRKGIAHIVVTNLASAMSGQATEGLLTRPGVLSLSLEEGVHVSTTLANLGAGLAIIALTLAVAAIALDIHRSADSIRLHRWAIRYQVLLWSASIFLVLMVVQLHFLIHWAADMAKAKEVIEPAQALGHLARAVPVAAGFAFSALVAAIFLPVAAIHQRRLDKLADSANAEASAAGRPFKREEWLAKSGLADGSPLRMLGNQAAVLLPLASGIVTHFLR